MPSLGFVLLTHNKPTQIHRLIDRLNQVFEHPAIQCHHDFSKCVLDRSRVSKNVQFVEPCLQTGWAEFSLVEATVRALQQLYARADAPDWFVLLSGTDYPTKTADSVIKDLTAGDFDAHMCLSLLERGSLRSAWERKCFRRYATSRVRLPSVDRSFNFRRRDVFLRIPFLTTKQLPFKGHLRLHSGSQWFCGNARAAESILKSHRENQSLIEHYRMRLFSDESYFHTILGSDPQLKVNSNNWRFVDFSKGKAHPNTLTTEDLPRILASHTHFARKFDLDTDEIVLEQIDQHLGLKTRASRQTR